MGTHPSGVFQGTFRDSRGGSRLAQGRKGPARSMASLRRMAAEAGVELPVLGSSPAIRLFLEMLLHVARANCTIFLRGRTGTGKGLMAELAHRLSLRAGKPFVDVVCGALAQSLIESELFGHEKGAFTGALGTKLGRFELADGGTLFLDEIGDLLLETQVKFLRVLQERKFERVGGTATLPLRARIIVATNREIENLTEGSGFRFDLLHRLKVVVLEVPPLCERKEDIPILVDAFLSEFGLAHRGYVPKISARAVRTLKRHSWPGNVRELRNSVERLVILDRKGRIDTPDLPAEIRGEDTRAAVGRLAPSPEEEERTLREAIHRCGGNRSSAAELVGLSRSHFYRLLGRYSI